MLLDFDAKHALLLQGPQGPFFSRFAEELRGRGIRVTKVNFHAGDGLFYRGSRSDDVIPFRGRMEEWPAVFRELVNERGIDAVFVFGDMRPIHRPAVRIAKQLGIAVWVFEEGYLRPNHITLERGGVNGNSSMPKDAEFFRREAKGLSEPAAPVPIGRTLFYSGLWASLNSIMMTLFWWRYRHYKHHRYMNCLYHFWCRCRSRWRKHWYAFRQRKYRPLLTGELSGKFFFVPLQVHCDAQLLHAPYSTMEELIEDIISSFAKHTSEDTYLVFKHHPLDRGYRNYTRFIRNMGKRYHCGARVIYTHDLHVPTLLDHARGTITMNSTVGTQSLQASTPLKVLGTAVYDIEGLTHPGSLAEFWANPGEVDAELYDCFRLWLLATNQINGSFYKRADGLPKESGLQLTAEPQRSLIGES